MTPALLHTRPWNGRGIALRAVNIARIVPGGLLVFFPSYTVLDACIEAWTAFVSPCDPCPTNASLLSYAALVLCHPLGVCQNPDAARSLCRCEQAPGESSTILQRLKGLKFFMTEPRESRDLQAKKKASHRPGSRVRGGHGQTHTCGMPGTGVGAPLWGKARPLAALSGCLHWSQPHPVLAPLVWCALQEIGSAAV